MTKDLVFYNRTVNKGRLKRLMSWAYTNYGSARCAQMADCLKQLGFRYATKAGVSISVDDLQVPPVKRQMLEEAEAEIRATTERYSRGEITEVERFQKVIDTWNSTSESLKEEVVRNFEATDPLNSVYMMAFSGARGNMSQVRQLVGMRGLMADPQGEIIDLPIKTNFREGLTVTEYIISSYGARKGLVDTALRTADSGYLTRRLVDVAQDVIVREIDCGTTRAIRVVPMKDGDRTLIPLQDRLFGRVLGEDVVSSSGETIAKRNQLMDEILADKIAEVTESAVVRSPLTCEASRSVCRNCYGAALATGRDVDLGEAVGIIAAQSIGEPGTQLTMRTFHTGGVFTGSVAKGVRSPIAGVASLKVRTRTVRTRHGDEREQVEVAGSVVVEPASGKSVSFGVSPGSLLLVKDGEKVVADQLLAEVPVRELSRSTERATKDVAADLAGEVFFDNLLLEEKSDRQGNTTRTCSRGGLIWVLSGEVYNLPPGAEPIVKNGDLVEPGTVMAETKLVSVSGGVCRTSGGREISIITASVCLDQARVRRATGGGAEQYTIHAANNQRFLLKATPGMKVADSQVVAELIDERYRTNTGGIIKYAGVEVAKGKSARKQGYEVIKGGTLLWIPEECHEVNKDISLLQVEDGQYVEAGTEVVKDVFSQSAGIVEVVQKNDILREVAIKPGEVHLLDELPGGSPTPELLPIGSEPLPGVVVEKLTWAEYVDTDGGMALLLRPVEEYLVADEPAVPSQASFNESGDLPIQMRAVQRLLYKDGERVKSVEGLELMRTQLVLEINPGEGTAAVERLSADIELIPSEDDEQEWLVQMVILESLVIRRDIEADPFGGGMETKVLVSDGEEIAPGAVVARTEIYAKEPGEVRGIKEGVEAIRRILVVRDADRMVIPTEEGTKSRLKPGQLVVAGTELGKGKLSSVSGQVVRVTDEEITLRRARPYRVSTNAVLHVEDGDLVQRGDNLVLLVFERAKTGDIIQGLPRIEELLEARKPKEACLLARRPGVAQVIYGDDETADVKVIEADGVVADYPVSPGQNVLVSDEQVVAAGIPLTDGPANPHEILELFFQLYVEEKGVYEAALIGLEQAQRFLVNEVQSVYQSQGIDISDKHIEVIVRQMTSKVRIDDGGDTTMLPGELVELRQVEQVNEAMSITGAAPARYTPVLLGITKASLNTDSFISAASFQETTRVLTEAAIEGKSDWLRGLKENVIIGRLIPAGTGFSQLMEEPLTLDSEASSDRSETGMASRNFRTSSVTSNDPMDVVLDDRTARAYSLVDQERTSQQRDSSSNKKRFSSDGAGSSTFDKSADDLDLPRARSDRYSDRTVGEEE